MGRWHGRGRNVDRLEVAEFVWEPPGRDRERDRFCLPFLCPGCRHRDANDGRVANPPRPPWPGLCRSGNGFEATASRLGWSRIKPRRSVSRAFGSRLFRKARRSSRRSSTLSAPDGGRPARRKVGYPPLRRLASSCWIELETRLRVDIVSPCSIANVATCHRASGLLV